MTKMEEAHVRAVRTSEVVLTENEKEWLVFWRAITAGRDPAPTLRVVQLVKRLLRRHGRGLRGAGGYRQR